MTRRVARAAQIGALALALALVPAALAAKGSGGGSGGHHGTSTSRATLTLSPSSVPSGGFFEGSGCGYTQGQQVNVVITSPSSQTFFPTGVDGNGCVAFGAWTSEPGSYSVATYQSGNGGKQSLMASAPLTVY